MHTGIALGSNRGDSLAILIRARKSLAELGSIVSGGLYQSDPVDCPPESPPFLNSVIELRTKLDPRTLLERCQKLEMESGRPREYALNAPRTLDLDLIYCDQLKIDEPDLTVPHPRAHHRSFVLAPLADIRPDLILPRQEKSVVELLAELESRQSRPKLMLRDW